MIDNICVFHVTCSWQHMSWCKSDLSFIPHTGDCWSLLLESCRHPWRSAVQWGESAGDIFVTGTFCGCRVSAALGNIEVICIWIKAAVHDQSHRRGRETTTAKESVKGWAEEITNVPEDEHYWWGRDEEQGEWKEHVPETGHEVSG